LLARLCRLSETAQAVLATLPRIGRIDTCSHRAFSRAFANERPRRASSHAERCLGHVMSGVRVTYDRHAYLEEKRPADKPPTGSNWIHETKHDDRRPGGIPGDESVRRWEGWILGHSI
jgi:hypothetical protein